MTRQGEVDRGMEPVPGVVGSGRYSRRLAQHQRGLPNERRIRVTHHVDRGRAVEAVRGGGQPFVAPVQRGPERLDRRPQCLRRRAAAEPPPGEQPQDGDRGPERPRGDPCALPTGEQRQDVVGLAGEPRLGSLVMAMTRPRPRWRRAASTTSRVPPDAEMATSVRCSRRRSGDPSTRTPPTRAAPHCAGEPPRSTPRKRAAETGQDDLHRAVAYRRERTVESGIGVKQVGERVRPAADVRRAPRRDRRSSTLLEEGTHALRRRIQPGREVGRRVRELVQLLVDLECVEQIGIDIHPHTTLEKARPIGLEKSISRARRSHASMSSPGRTRRPMVRLRSSARAPGHVIERAQHRRDVAQRRPMRPPLIRRAQRLAFEIDDPQAVRRDQIPDRGDSRRDPHDLGRGRQRVDHRDATRRCAGRGRARPGRPRRMRRRGRSSMLVGTGRPATHVVAGRLAWRHLGQTVTVADRSVESSGQRRDRQRYPSRTRGRLLRAPAASRPAFRRSSRRRPLRRRRTPGAWRPWSRRRAG